jgi:hypothetical protein
MKIRNAVVAASLLAASFTFPAPALAADQDVAVGTCINPYITRQVARGRAHWYLIRRGFERTANGKPRVIMGEARCEAGYWRVKVTLMNYAPKQKRSETILVDANSGKVVRNISIIG